MKSFLFFGRNPAAVLITILVVVFLGASYLYVYRPGNERRIKEQGFRAMQNIDGNVRAKIQNSVALLNNVLSAYISKSMGRDSITNYIKSISTEKFSLTKIDVLDSLKNKAEIEKTFKAGNDSVSSIQVDDASQQFKITFAKKYRGTGYRIVMEVSFEQFIKPLLPSNLLFDQYLVFGNGQIVYQTFPSGLNQIKSDSIFGKKGVVEGAKMTTREISGTSYQLFLQPVSFTQGSNWIIAGLLSDQKYQYEKNQLPSNLVLFMITVALAIIISFPCIKLFHMGSQDRLTLLDGILLVTVTMLLMSLLFFTLFKYNANFRPNNSPDSKNNLANAITNAFKTEIERKHSTLVAFDKLAQKDSLLRRNIVLGGKSGSHLSKSPLYPVNRQKIQQRFYSIDSIFKKANFGRADLNQVYWMNQSGKELFRWDSLQYNAPRVNFSERDWFKNIMSGKTYLDSLTGGRYYLDQLISWTTGKFTTVISHKSILSTANSTIVEAFAFNMKSLDQVILPAGYTFAMIDQNGKVLYHADKNRNLNENLLKEFSANEELRSCMEARAQKVFQTAYSGRDYNVEAKPITGLPYFIVIFSDINFKDTRDMETYCFTISMLIVFFSYLVIEMLAVFLASSNRSVFKKQQFDSNWIGPKASFHQQYILSSLLNIGIVLLLNFFFHRSTFAEFFFMLLFSSTAIIGFLICLYARRYQKEDNRVFFQNKIRAIYVLLVFILLINLLAWKNLEHFKLFFTCEIIILLLAAVLFVFGDDWIKKGRQMAVRYTEISWNYSHSFALLALTRLLITSGIPVVLFYVMSYNYEQNLVARFRHYDFARRIMEKNPSADSIYLSHLKDNTNAVYTDSTWVDSIGYSKQKITDTTNRYRHEESLTISVLNQFRFYKDSSAIRESHLYQSKATDLSFFYNPLFKDALYNNTGTTIYLETRNRGGYLVLRSYNLNYRLPVIFNKWEILFWLLMLLLLLVFYIIVLNIIRKLFALNLPATNIWKAIDDEVLLCQGLNKLVFIIGLPGSHKLFYLLSKIEDKELVQENGQSYIYDPQSSDKNNVLVLDLIEIPDNTDPASDDNIRWKKKQDDLFLKDYKLIVVNHFEYNIKDETTNRIKLNLLERLMVENKCKIIILSAIHPIAFLDSLNALAEATASKAVQDLERWHVLLGHYRIVIQPIERKAYNKRLPAWEEMIVKETQYTHFLIKMQNAAIKAAGSLPKKEKTANGDALAFKLQVTAHYFYMYIWQSLTKEEKFLLYDLAEDGLVNAFDDYNLSMLISKGVIVRTDGTLMLFNRGFRNFILTAIGNTEALKIRNQMQDNGNWGKLKTPLLVVIFAILAFLLASQQEAYSKLIAYITALATGIPTVIKLLSMFGNNNSGQKSS